MGWSWKVRASGEALSRLASWDAFRKRAWCPRCTPSNTPIVRTMDFRDFKTALPPQRPFGVLVLPVSQPRPSRKVFLGRSRPGGVPQEGPFATAPCRDRRTPSPCLLKPLGGDGPPAGLMEATYPKDR